MAHERNFKNFLPYKIRGNIAQEVFCSAYFLSYKGIVALYGNNLIPWLLLPIIITGNLVDQ